ncbi:RHS repeat-associated core domain-containing protein [Actinoplanes sp. NPDC051851]|uniref:RHS repeat-associated core domain-containing protein n=1 Tax=Actinoplanes sp. NPDC051851 TaxID=3154753 RepID=UPI00342AC08C
MSGSTLAKSTSIKNPADSSDSASYTGWQLTDTDGSVTTWTKGSTGIWAVAWVDEAGTEGETTYARDANGRVTTILAPTPTGVTCTTSSFKVAGCTALQLNYATATTAAGTGESGWGDYSGLISGITWTGYDPATSAVVTKQVAAYQYDSGGHLRAAWDPRLNTPLRARYSYDAAGRVSTITPAGINAWTLAYDTSGRIASVSQADPANGAAVQTVAYNVAVSGVTGAPDVSGTTAATWGQSSDLAYTGAAVFPASHVPPVSSAGAYTPGSGDWPYATIAYADIDGRVVNIAGYGAGAWQISSNRYDSDGNEIWTLDPGNRAEALNPTADTDPYVASQASSAARADLMATIKTYSDDGTDVTTTLAPASIVQLSSGDTASARVKTAYTYDAGAPNSDEYHLLTKTVVTPVALDGTTVPPADTRTTVTGYDPIDGSSSTGDTSGWILYSPTTETTWMGTSASAANDLTTKTRYDASGNVVESRLPGVAATDASTTVTTYYTAAANSTYPACGGKAYWAGEVCRTDAGGAPSSGYAVPSEVYTYGLYGGPATVTETSGSVTRVTTTTYDAAGRETGTSVKVSGLASSTAVSATSVGYDTGTGAILTTTQGTAALTSTYDAIGRALSYTDADGATTTYTYDIDGNLTSVNDAKATTAYTYDSASEHRGLITAVSAGMGAGKSDFTAVYNARGRLSAQTYPNGMTTEYDYDNTGGLRNLKYTLPTYTGGTAGTLEFADTLDAVGRTVHSQSPLSSQEYTYDNGGRLTSVEDTAAGVCTTRAYAFDKQSQRTSLTTYAAASEGTCQTTTSSGIVTNTFDTANRITNSGYAYDQLGRTTTVPAASVTSGSDALAVNYYDNDLPAGMSQGNDAKAYTTDPANRYRKVTDSTSGTEKKRILNHYAGASDSPSWTSSSSTDGGATYTWERYVTGIDGSLAAVQNSDGSSLLQINNLHGDVVATVPNQVPTATDTTGASTDAYFESTEYGIARSTTTATRYGWLGGKQRSGDALASVVLMGVRLYNPATGTFLTVDPVDGGSANAYDYCDADPVSCYDLDGRMAEAALVASLGLGLTLWEVVVVIGAIALTAIVGYVVWYGVKYAKRKLLEKYNRMLAEDADMSQHAKDQAGSRGISEDSIRNTIKNGKATKGKSHNTIKYKTKKIWVVVNKHTRKIVSVGWN